MWRAHSKERILPFCSLTLNHSPRVYLSNKLSEFPTTTSQECVPFTRNIFLPSCIQTDRSGRSGSSMSFSCSSHVKSESHAATTLALKQWSGQREAEGGQGIKYMSYVYPTKSHCMPLHAVLDMET